MTYSTLAYIVAPGAAIAVAFVGYLIIRLSRPASSPAQKPVVHGRYPS